MKRKFIIMIFGLVLMSMFVLAANVKLDGVTNYIMGDLGIGTQIPSAKVHLYSTSAQTGMIVQSTNDTSGVIPFSIRQEAKGVSSNYIDFLVYNSTNADTFFLRNLNSSNTIAPMINMRNDNSNDDQPILWLHQDAKAEAIIAFNTQAGTGTNDVRLADHNVSSGANYFYRNANSGNTSGAVVYINQDHADDDQQALYVNQDANADSAYFGVSGRDRAVITIQDSDGACSMNPEAGAITDVCASDRKIKKNIREVESDYLDYLNSIPLKEYEPLSNDIVMIGTIAQEMQEIYPEKVHEITRCKTEIEKIEENTNTTVTECIEYETILAVELPTTWELVKGIQQLTERVEILESKHNIYK